MTVKKALISVSDKSGIVTFAKQLTELGVSILSTGGTFALLSDSGIEVTEVSDYTGFAEMMDGRVKTLHPKIHGGILGRRDIDTAVMAEHGIEPIDLVVVNLYPFAKTIADTNTTFADAIENIDIGGPTMVRSAAKNHKDVVIVVDTSDYQRIIAELKHGGKLTCATKLDLATKAFEHTASYDGMIANYLGSLVNHSSADHSSADHNLADGKTGIGTGDTGTGDGTEKPAVYPRTFNSQFVKVQDLRYGENPHQSAAFYVENNPLVAHKQASISTSTQLQGKALSYNNIADTDAALECVKSFSEPACVIVKHANPCGVAVYQDSEQDGQTKCYQRAFATDSESSFGGIIAFNRELTEQTAKAIINNQFVEVIIAPSVADGVIDAVKTKKNVRLLTCGALPKPSERNSQRDFKRVCGGLLIQQQDLAMINASELNNELNIVTKLEPTEAQLADLLFTWRVAQYVKSNAIVYGKDGATVGVGAGQMSRVNSARIAAIKAEHAGLPTQGAVMASDAFFPFRDGIDNAAEVGISAIIQPGGSIRDQEVIDAADEHGIAMVFTGIRHFRH